MTVRSEAIAPPRVTVRETIYQLMNQEKINEFNRVAEEYRTLISDRMSVEDFRESNEILFSCHSCAIEGNTFTVDDTRTLKEKGLGMIPQGKSLVEAFEMLDHFAAYEKMVRTVNEPLTEAYLKQLHFLLTEHTIGYRHQGANPGEYTEFDMCAGDTIFGNHEQLIARVPDLLKSTEDALQDNRWHPMEVAARFHGHFEWLHPFRDGNGRIGRLLVNKILLQKQLPMLIITVDQRADYLTCMKKFRMDAEPLTDFFFDTSISRMKKEIEQKRNATENFRQFWLSDEINNMMR